MVVVVVNFKIVIVRLLYNYLYWDFDYSFCIELRLMNNYCVEEKGMWF